MAIGPNNNNSVLTYELVTQHIDKELSESMERNPGSKYHSIRIDAKQYTFIQANINLFKTDYINAGWKEFKPYMDYDRDSPNDSTYYRVTITN